jgi:hypothetical protein
VDQRSELKNAIMTATNVAAQSSFELQCVHRTVIIRNASLEDKFPGGLNAFRRQYSAEANDHITVHRVPNAGIGNTIRKLEAVGLLQGEDFTTIDTVECEMWRLIHSDEIERPFWFETGADWLQYKHWNGKVLVWYDG